MSTSPVMTEAELQRAVISLARDAGYLVHHSRPAMMRSDKWSTPLQGTKGCPDLLIVGKGRVLHRELKAGKGRMSPEQAAWGQALLEAGADYAVWTPTDWPAAIGEQLGLSLDNNNHPHHKGVLP